MNAVIVVPSLKISGGIREVLRLASELNRDGCKASLLSLWVSPHPMDAYESVTNLSTWPPRPMRALVELPILAFRFLRWKQRAMRGASAFVFTHYATLPLALLIPSRQRFFFVQDLEWNFIGNYFLSRLLRRLILGIYHRGRVISANAYLSERLVAEGIDVALEAPIWASASFLAPITTVLDIDFAMVLRKGAHKRLDLYLQFIALARARKLRIAVITPENDIAQQVQNQVDEVLLRPQHPQMRDLYARTACFIHLSEHEGFGLPPLEAMGAGCVPICRDSGGVRAFMRQSPCSDLLLPLSMPLEEIVSRAEAIVRDHSLGERRVAVRNHFQQGLLQCEQQRNGLVSALLKKEFA